MRAVQSRETERKRKQQGFTGNILHNHMLQNRAMKSSPGNDRLRSPADEKIFSQRWDDALLFYQRLILLTGFIHCTLSRQSYQNYLQSNVTTGNKGDSRPHGVAFHFCY